MIEGAPILSWIGFHVLVVALLLADLFLPKDEDHAVSVRVAWGWTAFLAVIAGCFAFWILRIAGAPAGTGIRLRVPDRDIA